MKNKNKSLIVFIIFGLIIVVVYNLIKNDYFNLSKIDNINIFSVKINDQIDNYFTKSEIKKYSVKIGDIKKEFGVLNLFGNSKKFQNNYDVIQFIYAIDTRNIWEVSAIESIDPDTCLDKRNERFNDFKISYNIINIDETLLDFEKEYKQGSYNRLISYIGYFLDDTFDRMARISCYDNRQAIFPEGSDANKYEYNGELRYELLRSDNYKIKK
jgi:hypothetical protein